MKYIKLIRLRSRTLYFLRLLSFIELFMVALWNRADHYIFILRFLLSSFFLSYFPGLISAVRDWMSAIRPHMVWPYCKFRMQV